MNKLSDILKLVGSILLVFSAIITFKMDWPEIEDIIYYRGICLGSMLIIAGSAITAKNFYIQGALISLGSGNLVLLIVSTLNLIYNDLIDLDDYFDYTVITVLVTLLILLILKLWFRRLLILLGF